MSFVITKHLAEREDFLISWEPNKVVLEVEGQNVGVANGLPHDGLQLLHRSKKDSSRSEKGCVCLQVLIGERIMWGESGEEREEPN